jgi:prepilin-type N-terminal cleavage/methylation domain-containing protein
MKRPDSGFTLVELMMAVAVLGVLLAVAVPLYSDYQTRARVAQVLTAIDTLRTVFHAEYEVEGGIPTFAPGKEGEIPPELARLPIGPELLRFDYLSEHLVQSSHHYGPFEGKDIPYLVLKANDATQSRYLAALAHALPHSSYAWMLEPTIMVVPLLDARARHDTVVNAKQTPPPMQVPAQPKPLEHGSDGTPSCPPGEVPDPSNPQLCMGGSSVDPQFQDPDTKQTSPPGPSCPPGEVPDPSNPQLCVGGSEVVLQSQNPDTTQAPDTPQTAATQTNSGPSAQQQYNDCRAHVLANHPHGHAYGLLRQCNRYLH